MSNKNLISETNKIKRRLILNETMEEKKEHFDIFYNFCDPNNITDFNKIRVCLLKSVSTIKGEGGKYRTTAMEAIRALDEIESEEVKKQILSLYKFFFRKSKADPKTKVYDFMETINTLFTGFQPDEERVHSELVLGELLKHLEVVGGYPLDRSKVRKALRAVQCYLFGFRMIKGEMVECTRVQQNKPETLSQELTDLRHQEYTRYEDSFAEYGFNVVRKWTTSIKDTSVSTEELFAFESLKQDLSDDDLENLAEQIARHIDDFVSSVDGDKDGEKYDLVYDSDRPIKSGDKVIISKGDRIEVKKMSTKSDSYLSEFFALDKNKKYIEEFTNNPKLRQNYNTVIEKLYKKLKPIEDRVIDFILGTSENKVKGIFFDNYLFVPIEDINFYLSDEGQRRFRLTIRFSVDKFDNIYKLKKNKHGSYFVKVQ